MVDECKWLSYCRYYKTSLFSNFQVETLQKSLKSASLNSMGSSNGTFSSGQDPSNLSMSQSVQNQLVQVKELEEEVSYISILQFITCEICCESEFCFNQSFTFFAI